MGLFWDLQKSAFFPFFWHFLTHFWQVPRFSSDYLGIFRISTFRAKKHKMSKNDLFLTFYTTFLIQEAKKWLFWAIFGSFLDTFWRILPLIIGIYLKKGVQKG